MRKHKLYLSFTVMAALLFFWAVDRNMGQDMQSNILHSADDITAWQEAVFVLDNKTLVKLNADLETVKSIPLPTEPVPLPPQPIPNAIMPPEMLDSSVSPQAGAMGSQLTGRICADSGHIFVLFEGVIYVFDHDLNFTKSKALEYSP